MGRLDLRNPHASLYGFEELDILLDSTLRAFMEQHKYTQVGIWFWGFRTSYGRWISRWFPFRLKWGPEETRFRDLVGIAQGRNMRLVFEEAPETIPTGPFEEQEYIPDSIEGEKPRTALDISEEEDPGLRGGGSPSIMQWFRNCIRCSP